MDKLRRSSIFLSLVIAVVSKPYLVYDTECQPRDCSQPKNFRFNGDHKFPCSILQLKGFEDFAKSVNISNILSSKKRIDVGLLEEVDVYVKTYNDSIHRAPSMALNLSFSIPFHLKDGFEHRSIVMQFRGIKDINFLDHHYSDKERIRVFNFTSYMPSPSDREHSFQRRLQYDCLVGLEKMDFRVYNITFSLLPSGAKIVYFIATYNQIKEKDWKPTIALAALPSNKIHVVFEKAPESLKVEKYKIELVHWTYPSLPGPAIQSTVIKHGQDKHSHVFDVPAAGGAYSVVVWPTGAACTGRCAEFTSSYKLEFPIKAINQPVGPMKILYAVLGSCLALLLILIFMSVIYKTNVNKNICRWFKQDKDRQCAATPQNGSTKSQETKSFIEPTNELLVPSSPSTVNMEMPPFIPPSPIPSVSSNDDDNYFSDHNPEARVPSAIPHGCRTGICRTCNHPNEVSDHNPHQPEYVPTSYSYSGLQTGLNSFGANQEALKNILFANS